MTDELTALRARLAELERASLDVVGANRESLHESAHGNVNSATIARLTLATHVDILERVLRVVPLTPDPRDARIAELEAALRPFAEAARYVLIDRKMHAARRHHYSKMPGTFPLKVEVTVEQARDAMQAMCVGDLTAEQQSEIDAYLARQPSRALGEETSGG